MKKLKPDILFVLSVDTEEEWDWSGSFPQSDFSVTNLSRIPAFQQFCNENEIRPTYFMDYAAAGDVDASRALKQYSAQGQCEIGAHLHPWSNPPYFGYTSEKESHVVNLPIEQVEEKLDQLLRMIHKNLGVIPTSFRTGRWGINAEVLKLLAKKGFKIDSSMYPFYRNEYFDCNNVYPEPYWPNIDNPHEKGRQRNILEFPVTVGFNRGNFVLMDKIHRLLSRPSLSPFRMIGLLWQTKLLRKLYLSPEVISGQEMIPLVDVTIANHSPVIHMYLHSSSLIEGNTGYMKEKGALSCICENIMEVVSFAKTRANIRFCTISEATSLLSHRGL